MSAQDLSRERAREFTAARRAAGRRSGRSLRSLARVLAALARAGVLAPDSPAGPASEQERLLAAFGQFLRCERALAAGTAGAYLGRARRFLAGLAWQSGLFRRLGRARAAGRLGGRGDLVQPAQRAQHVRTSVPALLVLPREVRRASN